LSTEMRDSPVRRLVSTLCILGVQEGSELSKNRLNDWKSFHDQRTLPVVCSKEGEGCYLHSELNYKHY
jgi:hypothetical protein